MTTRRASMKKMLVAAGALTATGAFTIQAQPQPQPHMQKALAALRDAHEALTKASPDKGGHRAKAMKLVTEAISEVDKGIKFDNKH